MDRRWGSGDSSGRVWNPRAAASVSEGSGQALESGEARLTCTVSCSGSWGYARANAKRLYDNELWRDLEELVAHIGLELDQTYYYLGRAAEGQGHAAAARTYYRLALAVEYKCDAMINNCDGLDVPALARSALQRLPAETLGDKVPVSN